MSTEKKNTTTAKKATDYATFTEAKKKLEALKYQITGTDNDFDKKHRFYVRDTETKAVIRVSFTQKDYLIKGTLNFKNATYTEGLAHPYIAKNQKLEDVVTAMKDVVAEAKKKAEAKAEDAPEAEEKAEADKKQKQKPAEAPKKPAEAKQKPKAEAKQKPTTAKKPTARKATTADLQKKATAKQK